MEVFGIEALPIIRTLLLSVLNFWPYRIVLSGVHCQGNETNLFKCQHEDLGNVICRGEAGKCYIVFCYSAQIAPQGNISRSLNIIYLGTSHVYDVFLYRVQLNFSLIYCLADEVILIS